MTEIFCDKCEHELKYHRDSYGCEVELGDTLDGSRAKGPCGCTVIQVTEVDGVLYAWTKGHE